MKMDGILERLLWVSLNYKVEEELSIAMKSIVNKYPVKGLPKDTLKANKNNR